MFGSLLMMESIFSSYPEINFFFRSADSLINEPEDCEIGFRACCLEQLAKIKTPINNMASCCMIFFINQIVIDESKSLNLRTVSYIFS